MTVRDRLAQRFETNREHLWGARVPNAGVEHEADDAVQEARPWLSRVDAVDNVGGCLTTVMVRVRPDTPRVRVAKREVPPDAAPTW